MVVKRHLLIAIIVGCLCQALHATNFGDVPASADVSTLWASFAFKTISVSGQSDVVAGSTADTLTLASGSNITITTNAGTNTVTIASSSSGGTVTHTGGPLTANAVVLGAGADDVKVTAGIVTDGTAKLTLGVNTTTLGQLKLFGNTSGDATIQPPAVAGTATVVTLPNASSTLPIFNQQITFSGPTAARTVTFPDANFTAARTDAANTFTGHQTIEGVTSTGATGTGKLVFDTSPRINPRIGTETSSSTSTPTADTVDQWNVTALAVADAFAAPSGSPVDGQKLIIRIKDNGTARALTWNAIYRASSDLGLPSTTVLSKTLYLGFIYNAADSKWDLLAVLNNF